METARGFIPPRLKKYECKKVVKTAKNCKKSEQIYISVRVKPINKGFITIYSRVSYPFCVI